MTDSEGSDGKTGYGKAPAATRFKKGQSGNYRGRPKGRHKELPYEAVLGQMVTIREGDTERRVTAAEAFLLHLTKKGLEGDSAAARVALPAMEEARQRRLTRMQPRHFRITRRVIQPGSVCTALEPLRMGVKLDRYRESARVLLEPWLVEAALARLGDGRLTLAEQDIIHRATRTPNKVKWPLWWKGRLVRTL